MSDWEWFLVAINTGCLVMNVQRRSWGWVAIFGVLLVSQAIRAVGGAA